MAANRHLSYTPPDPTFPEPDDNIDVDSDVELFGETAVEEKKVIESNRFNLTQYIHDCTVLFPFMKQEKVFTNDDCDLIKNEVTGSLRVDKFIDIVLSKGPRGIAKFHEALAIDYPAVFDVLCRLFTNNGISLPPSRQLKELDFDDEQIVKVSSEQKTGWSSRVSVMISRGHGMRTIKKHFNELDRQCAEARSQKDELQRVLIQREMEINTLLRNRDVWMQQNLTTVNEKYQDLLVQLVKWREQVVSQSDGNIDLLVRERETIQEEYLQLEAEYMLTVSELSAAKDRISKLLTHLEQTDKEVTIASERQQDKIAQLEDKIAQLEGENQRQLRKLDRLSKEPISLETSNSGCDDIESESGTNKQLTKVVEEKDDFKNRMEAALRERKETMEELDRCNNKLHTEKQKRKHVEKELKIVRSQVDSSDVISKRSTTASSWSPSMTYFQSDPVSEDFPGKMQGLTLVLPAQGCEMKLGLGVLVRDVDTEGKAWKNGVRVGDEIQHINHINITSDSEPLTFARKLLGSADGTVTLYVKRQSTGSGSGLLRTTPYTPLSGTPVSPYSTGGSLALNPLELELIRRTSEGYSPTIPVRQPPNMMSLNGKFSSTTPSTSARDTSGSEESDSYASDGYNSKSHGGGGGCGFQTTSKLHTRESDTSVQTGIFGSPRNSNPKPSTLNTGLSSYAFDLSEQPISPQRILGSSDSDSPQQSPQQHPRRLTRENRVIRPKRPRKSTPSFLSQSSQLDEVESLQQVQRSISSDHKRVLLPHSQLGDGLTLIGGRGYGIFIVSDSQRRQSDFQTGDEVLQIAHKSVHGWTYCQLMDVLESYALRGTDCMMTLRSNIEGFSKLPSNSSRDNFYVRAKLSHQKSNKLGDLGYQRGDIFRIADTKPEGQSGVWGAEKINSKGELIESGYLPLILNPQELSEAPGGGTGMTLPNMTVLNTLKGTVSPLYTLQASSRTGHHISTEEAFQIYEPIRKVEATDPRPVVLVGSHEPLIRRQLVEHGSDAEIKFAYCRREPSKNLEGVSRDKIVESIVTEDGVFQSTVDYVNEIAKKGCHCVLCLDPSDLPNPGVTALTPIVLLLNPKRGFKIKHPLKTVPSGNLHSKPSLTVEQIKEIGRKYKIYITGQIELTSSTMHLNDIIQAVRSTVARQQKSVIWEVDH